MGEYNRDQVFISYAHEDAHWREAFERMLAPAQERGLLKVWSDEAIVAGEYWAQNIKRALKRARVGLLLVTDRFLESQFINQEELTSLLASAKSGGVSIRWVPVSASLYQCTEAQWNPGLLRPEEATRQIVGTGLQGSHPADLPRAGAGVRRGAQSQPEQERDPARPDPGSTGREVHDHR